MISRTAQRPSLPLMDEDQRQCPSRRHLGDLPLRWVTHRSLIIRLVWRGVACNCGEFAKARQIVFHRPSGRCEQRPSSGLNQNPRVRGRLGFCTRQPREWKRRLTRRVPCGTLRWTRYPWLGGRVEYLCPFLGLRQSGPNAWHREFGCRIRKMQMRSRPGKPGMDGS
jgi:hypothetical protein